MKRYHDHRVGSSGYKHLEEQGYSEHFLHTVSTSALRQVEGFAIFLNLTEGRHGHSHGNDALESLIWLCLCQQYTFTLDFILSLHMITVQIPWFCHSFLFLCISYRSSTYGMVDTFELLLCAESPVICKSIALTIWKIWKLRFSLCMTYFMIWVSTSPVKLNGCSSWARNEYHHNVPLSQPPRPNLFLLRLLLQAYPAACHHK